MSNEKEDTSWAAHMQRFENWSAVNKGEVRSSLVTLLDVLLAFFQEHQ